ncbi:hypothetical protein GCM10020000_63810 [Streptomyces olivoverticillatus]
MPRRAERRSPWAARPSPFGLDPRSAEACLPLLRGRRLRLRGIHAHLASGLGPEAQLAVAARVTDWARDLASRHRLQVTEVDVGGGMAVDYARPGARFDWQTYGRGLRELTAKHPDFTLRVEPGRALTAYCGWYVTEVLDLKHTHGEAFAVLRGGTHHLRTPRRQGPRPPLHRAARRRLGPALAAPGGPRRTGDPQRATVHAQGRLRAAGARRTAAGGGPGRLRDGRCVRLEHLAPRLPDAPAAHVPLFLS